jgi:hypothetical protein
MRCSIAITVDGSKMWLATRRNGNPREVTLVDRNTRDTLEFYTTSPGTTAGEIEIVKSG